MTPEELLAAAKAAAALFPDPTDAQVDRIATIARGSRTGDTSTIGLNGTATAAEVAQWMVDHITACGHAEHETIVREIDERFGPDSIDANADDNPAISRAVLREFRKIHAGSIAWNHRTWSVI